jgi:transposase
MYPRLWGLSGVPLPDLCNRLVQLAVERKQHRARIDESLRAFVAGAADGRT